VDAELALNKELQKLQASIDLAQRQRDEIANGSSRVVQEAVVYVNIREEAGGQLHQRYLVNAATWTPSYNVRTDAERKDVKVEYNASIVQTSGEDWSNVNMTLSTATPSLVARAPKLDPLAIALGPAEQSQAAVFAGKDYNEAKSELFNQLKQVEGQRGQNDFTNSSGGVGGGGAGYQPMPGYPNGPGGGPGTPPQMPGQAFGVQVQSSLEFDVVLNSVAGQLQVLDLVTDSQDAAKKPTGPTAKDEGLSVTYALEGRTSLPSRSDRQLIQIASMNMKGDFYKVATPVLTNYVYEEASVANSSQMVLLAGPVSAFVAGQFVGTGDIPTVSVGETFTVGLGIDAALRASRELVARDTKVQGGNRMVSFVYRIAIENFGATPALVRVYDRMPTADASQVKVTLVTPGGDLSQDATFVNTQKKKGLLRWDLEASPQTAGLAAKAIEYEFQVEYDKQYSVAGLPAKK
ncbi:MAG TPA: mucoidy inhibitor MuiA family protein, partial [Pirellulales bacterium]